MKANYIAGNPPEDILQNITENHQQQIEWYKKHLKSTFNNETLCTVMTVKLLLFGQRFFINCTQIIPVRCLICERDKLNYSRNTNSSVIVYMLPYVHQYCQRNTLVYFNGSCIELVRQRKLYEPTNLLGSRMWKFTIYKADPLFQNILSKWTFNLTRQVGVVTIEYDNQPDSQITKSKVRNNSKCLEKFCHNCTNLSTYNWLQTDCAARDVDYWLDESESFSFTSRSVHSWKDYHNNGSLNAVYHSFTMSLLSSLLVDVYNVSSIVTQ